MAKLSDELHRRCREVFIGLVFDSAGHLWHVACPTRRRKGRETSVLVSRAESASCPYIAQSGAKLLALAFLLPCCLRGPSGTVPRGKPEITPLYDPGSSACCLRGLDFALTTQRRGTHVVAETTAALSPFKCGR